MELVSLVKEVLHTAAESAASYRFGQSVLRYMDRALWIVEKSARWAVPPPLDQDDRPQPELVRPLPWVFFFALLIMLRVTRESISLLNLALGKPPLRSADVVTYLQGKRRYLRTLKYQGNRTMRARTESVARHSWCSHLQSMLEFTMCFRRRHYGNNNTQLINGDEMLVVKRNKRTRQEASTVVTTCETSMERLIEKMMVDIDVDSDESSGYTLTNLTSGRSDRTDYNTESDQETASNPKTQERQSGYSKTVQQTQEDRTVNQCLDNKTVEQGQDNEIAEQRKDNKTVKQNEDNKIVEHSQDDKTVKQNKKQSPDISLKENNVATSPPKNSNTDKSSVSNQSNDSMTTLERGNNTEERNLSTKQATLDFIQNETGSQRSAVGYSHYEIDKMCNGLYY